MKNTYQQILNQKTKLNTTKFREISTIDMHTGGEPLRVILDGFPTLEGNTVLERRAYCANHHDDLRTALMFEPRGHADMYGAILIPPNDDQADFGVLFIHNEGYSTMCGHAIIALSTLAVEMEWFSVKEGENILKIDAPCGRITSFVEVKNKAVVNVSFHCVPSFVLHSDMDVEVKGLGNIYLDVAYGGAFYAYVDLDKNHLDLNLDASDYGKIIDYGMRIKRSVMEKLSIEHPEEQDLSFLYGTIFVDQQATNHYDSKNVCVFAEGEVDRCPTGSGVAGRMAIHHHRGDLKLNQVMKINSITNSQFEGSVVETLDFNGYDAVIPKVSGTAYITGVHRFLIDENDPFRKGFIFR